jgi:hypothetical protein
MSKDIAYDSFDSRDSVVVVIDGPGDTTIRPCRPHLRPFLEAIKRKLEQYGDRRDDERADPSQS